MSNKLRLLVIFILFCSAAHSTIIEPAKTVNVPQYTPSSTTTPQIDVFPPPPPTLHLSVTSDTEPQQTQHLSSTQSTFTHKKQRKNKPDESQKTYVCSHSTCAHGNYGDQRAKYTTKQRVQNHEILRVEHPCSSTCKTCKHWNLKGMLIEPNSTYISCQHTSCLSKLKNRRSLLDHMSNFALHRPEKCGQNCVGCKTLVEIKQKTEQVNQKQRSCYIQRCSEKTQLEIKQQNLKMAQKFRNLADEIENDGVKQPINSQIIKGNLPEGWVMCHFGSETKKGSVMSLERYEIQTQHLGVPQGPNLAPFFKDGKKESCTLQDVNWKTLLKGRESNCSIPEKARRIAEAETLLEHIFHLPFHQALGVLLQKKEITESILDHFPELYKQGKDFSHHTIQALLAFKDRLTIPDHEWPYVVEFMNLGDNASLHYLRRARQEKNQHMNPQPTAGGRGHKLDIEGMVKYLLEKNPPIDNSQPVEIKFSFDGGTMTSGKRIKQEQGTFQILTNYSSRDLKSHTSAHQWLIYLGDEDYQTFEEELCDSIPELMSFVDKKITVNNKEYTIESYLVCDMKCLVKILGLYEVFHPCSHYKCVWCNITSDQMGNFEVPSWSLRNIEDLLVKAKTQSGKSEKTKSAYARKNEGIKNLPLLPFPLERIVPCMLHVTMGLVKMMIKHLCAEADGNITFTKQLQETFSSIGIKLAPDVKNDRVQLFSEQLKASRLQRPQYLALMENCEKFLDLYKEYGKKSANYKHAVELLWAQFYYLLSLASVDNAKITEKEWLTKACVFGSNFVRLHFSEDVTPYLHVFVYHLGFYLEKYGGIDKFANYGIEGRVRYNKRIITTGTSGFSRINSAYNVTFQELTRSWREDVDRIEHPGVSKECQKRKRGDHCTWAERKLKTYQGDIPSFEQVLIADFMEDEDVDDSLSNLATVASNHLTTARDKQMDELAKHKVTELKEMLKQKGLKISGTKKELVERLLPED